MRTIDKSISFMSILKKSLFIFLLLLGSVVLIHGQVMHKSEDNKSEKSRHAFTFHMIETQGSEYSKENWLQPTEDLPFPKLFSVDKLNF